MWTAGAAVVPGCVQAAATPAIAIAASHPAVIHRARPVMPVPRLPLVTACNHNRGRTVTSMTDGVREMARPVRGDVLALLVVATSCSDDPRRCPRPHIDGGTVHAIDRAPEGEAKGVVLFLHGGSYTSEVWDRTGLLDDVVDAGWRGVAIDLPGSGDSDESSLDPVDFLGAVVDELGEPPVIVSPSASGSYSLPFVAAHPDRVRGYVPVAPVGAATFSMPPGVDPPPTVVAWGSEDDLFDPSIAPELADALGGRAVVIDGAGHSAYEDDPAAFRRLLVELPRLAQRLTGWGRRTRRTTMAATAATTRNGRLTAMPAAR